MGLPAVAAVLSVALLAGPAPIQTSAPVPEAASEPLPDVRALLTEVEANQRRLEAMQRDYTYHVRTVRQDLNKSGGVKETETIDAESLTVDGVRVDRVVAKNGKPLTPEEQAKEGERIDKEVAKAKQRREKAASRGSETNQRGEPTVSLARILELGSFSNERRIDLAGRKTIVLDYAGDPKAKTRTPFEAAFRCLAGTVWIDEADHVLVRGEARFLSDFKLGGGLLADLHKGTTFSFRAARVNDSVWLPAQIDGQGSVRVLLFTSFNGSLHLTASDYRRFRTSATILPGHGVIDDNGQPVDAEGVHGEGKPATPDTPPPLPQFR